MSGISLPQSSAFASAAATLPPDLPQPVLLLHLAQLHLHQAHQLIPRLTVRPRHQYHLLGTLHYKHEPIQESQLTWAASAYRQHVTIAVGCLRSILTLAQAPSAESVSIELNLVARCKLVHVLISETNEYQQALELIQHGLNISRQREDLTPFKLTLFKSLIQIEASDPNVSFRQLKKQIERAIETTTKNKVIDQKYIAWYYHFQLLICHISYERAKDFPAALAALRNVLSLAELRNDWELWMACKTHEIKLAMDRCEWTLVSELFKRLVPLVEFGIELPSSPTTPEKHQPPPQIQQPHFEKIRVGQQLKMYTMLLLIIFYSIVGEAQLAKGWLKHLRTELDSAKREEGQAEGNYKIYLKVYSAQTHQRVMAQFSPSNSHFGTSSTPFKVLSEDHTGPSSKSTDQHSSPNVNSQYVVISIMPREVMYSLTYLVSLTVYFDGHGKLPKSLNYAREGLKQIDRQLTIGFQNIGNDHKHTSNSHDNNNDEFQSWDGPYCYYPSMITSINFWLKTLLAMKLETNILVTQLAIVRSDFLYADQLLVEIIRRVSDPESWEIYNARISFLKSMLSHATGNLAFARQSLLTTLHLVQRRTKLSNQVERLSYAGELSTLSKACYFLVRIASSDLNAGQRTPRVLDGSSLSDLPRSLALNHLVKELSCASQLAIPNIDMAIQVVLAMSCGEIVKAKYHLTTALNEANKTSNTHLKMILLGLLSTMFLNTRSDQATAMLKSCFKLSLGFSSSSFSTPATQKNRHLASDSGKTQALGNQSGSCGSNDVVVGNPSLGLWVGKKLVEIYELQESTAINEDEKKMLQLQIQRLKLSNFAHQNLLSEIPTL